MLTVKIIPNDKNNPPGKLADAELHFTAPHRKSFDALIHTLAEPAASIMEGIRDQVYALEGLKLIGFGVWERRTGGGRNVTYPARQYSVNGERRSFALLRPTFDATAQDRIRDLILDAYATWERDQKDGVDGRPEHEGTANHGIDY